MLSYKHMGGGGEFLSYNRESKCVMMMMMMMIEKSKQDKNLV